MVFLDIGYSAANTDDQKKPQSDQRLEYLGEKIDAKGPDKEETILADRNQADYYPSGGQEKGCKVLAAIVPPLTGWVGGRGLGKGWRFSYKCREQEPQACGKVKYFGTGSYPFHLGILTLPSPSGRKGKPVNPDP